MRRLFFIFFWAAILAAGFFPSPRVWAEERIRDLHSDIVVNPDSTLVVTETIRLETEGHTPGHWIYRDFTTVNPGIGVDSETGFRLLGVLYSGDAEAYRLVARPDGWRVYIGWVGAPAASGERSYTIKYQSNRQLNFKNSGFDELFWNVTGHGWDFPVEQASVTLHLPPQVLDELLEIDGFTGSPGAYRKDYSCERDSRNRVVCQTTAAVPRREDFSVRIRWGKGMVPPPSMLQKMQWFLDDHLAAGIGLWGVGLMCFYFLVVWVIIGIDPKKRTIKPLKKPPKGVSPAMARFIRITGFDEKIMAVAMVSMAVKGYVRIIKGRHDYSLEKLGVGREILTSEEREIADAVFPFIDRFDIDKKNIEHFKAARSGVESTLVKSCEKVYFRTNGGFFLGGLLLSAAIFGMMIYAGVGLFQGTAVVVIVFSVAGIALTDMLLYRLLKAPVHAGRKIIARVRGFRLFLETAKIDEIRALCPADQLPRLYEEYLPYAMALDVEKTWSDRLVRLIKESRPAPPAGASGVRLYSPGWIEGWPGRWSGYDFSVDLEGSIDAAFEVPLPPAGRSSGSRGGPSGGVSSGVGGR